MDRDDVINRDELINEEDIDPLRTITLGELLQLVGYSIQAAPELSHAALPRDSWALLGRPRYLLVAGSCLSVVVSDTLAGAAYFYCEEACN